MPKGWSVWVESSKDRWRCRWNGQYGSDQQTFIYKGDAQEFAANKRREFERLQSGLSSLSLTKQTSYLTFEAEYLIWLKARRSKRTCYINKRALTLYRESRKENTFPGKPEIRQFSNWLLTKYKPNAARIYLRASKAAFRWAWKQGMIDYDPFQFFEMPAADPVARVLTPEDAKYILHKLPKSIKYVFAFVLFSGLRISEVISLDWSNIKENNGIWYLTVLKSKTRRSKPETKTQAIHHKALEVMGTPQKSGKVFYLSASWMQRALRKTTRDLGLGRVRWHDLRHTWATYLMQQSGDLRALMDVGGWTTSQAAMLYQHPTSERRNITLVQNFPLPIPYLRVTRSDNNSKNDCKISQKGH